MKYGEEQKKSIHDEGSDVSKSSKCKSHFNV